MKKKAKVISEMTGQTIIRESSVTVCFGNNNQLNMICRGGYPLYIINDDLSRTSRFIELLNKNMANNSIYIITTEKNRKYLMDIANVVKRNNVEANLRITKKKLGNMMLANKNTIRIGGGMFLNPQADLPSPIAIKDSYLYDYYVSQFNELASECEIVYDSSIIPEEGLFANL